MNTTFNQALKQSTAIRKDLSALSNPSFAGGDAVSASNLTPAALGALSASLTSFSRTVDEYGNLAKQELNSTKQEKAFERVKNFRTELHEFRAQFDSLKSARDDAAQTQARAELLGRRPFATSTPENPYANSGTASGSGFGMAPGGSHARSGNDGRSVGDNGQDYGREQHVVREQNFLASTNSALDEYIARGQAVLGDLGNQRETLKNTQRRLYTVANTLGLSGDTIRMIERRAMQDKWIFWGGVIVFFALCWLVLHYLR